MYSISSQIFEGLTEYVISSKTKSHEELDQQEGEQKSGSIMADIITQSSNEVEKKFLHDYAYNLFEESLNKKGKVLYIDSENVDIEIDELVNASFVKVKGRIIFNDSEKVENTIRNFNELGYSTGYLVEYSKLHGELEELQDNINNITDRNVRAKKQNMLNNTKANFKKYLIERGLQKEEEFIKSLAHMIEFGFEGAFEAQMPLTTDLDHYLFSAVLNKEMLKEHKNSIIKKYSRETQKEFILFGIPSQVEKYKESISALNAFSSQSDKLMKESVMDIVEAMKGLERSVAGKLEYEYVIDPIAIYIEI